VAGTYFRPENRLVLTIVPKGQAARGSAGSGAGVGR
jgi:hypothetical protein